MKHDHSDNSSSDFDSNLDNDAVWNLLDDATLIDPSPRFVQDTLRRVRLEESMKKSSWWKALSAHKPLVGVVGATLAAVAIVISLPSDPIPADGPVAATPQAAEDFDQLEDTFATELLSGAAEDPTLLSDEEIVTLLY
ncbi:MAG: hypothetical protein ABF379_08540 [Akkermansiaceae bacterium]|jgi:hypothetical protein